jgi:hypothetical protein
MSRSALRGGGEAVETLGMFDAPLAEVLPLHRSAAWRGPRGLWSALATALDLDTIEMQAELEALAARDAGLGVLARGLHPRRASVADFGRSRSDAVVIDLTDRLR